MTFSKTPCNENHFCFYNVKPVITYLFATQLFIMNLGFRYFVLNEKLTDIKHVKQLFTFNYLFNINIPYVRVREKFLFKLATLLGN